MPASSHAACSSPNPAFLVGSLEPERDTVSNAYAYMSCNPCGLCIHLPLLTSTKIQRQLCIGDAMVWIASKSQAHPTYLEHQQMLGKTSQTIQGNKRHASHATMRHMLERVSQQRKPLPNIGSIHRRWYLMANLCAQQLPCVKGHICTSRLMHHVVTHTGPNCNKYNKKLRDGHLSARRLLC